MNAINCMNLAQLKTVTEQHQLSELFCQVYTMLLSAEKTPLQNLLCSDSPNKTQIGAIAVLFVFLSLASKPSERPKHFCRVVLLTRGDLQLGRAARCMLGLLL